MVLGLSLVMMGLSLATVGFAAGFLVGERHERQHIWRGFQALTVLSEYRAVTADDISLAFNPLRRAERERLIRREWDPNHEPDDDPETG